MIGILSGNNNLAEKYFTSCDKNGIRKDLETYHFIVCIQDFSFGRVILIILRLH